MLAHGLYTEHVVAALLGLVGLCCGFLAIVLGALRKRHWGKLACVGLLGPIGFFLIAPVCGADPWVVQSEDCQFVLVPSIVVAVIGLLVGVARSPDAEL